MPEPKTCKYGHAISGDNIKIEGKYAACRECQNRRTRESYARHRKKRLAKAARWGAAHKEQRAEQNRRSKLKLHYDLTPEKVDEQLKLQDGKCANPGCGATTPGQHRKNWRIDHDHTTGKFRGLLCNGCNVALGMTGENESRILGLVEYLKTCHNSK